MRNAIKATVLAIALLGLPLGSHAGQASDAMACKTDQSKCDKKHKAKKKSCKKGGKKCSSAGSDHQGRNKQQ